MLHFVALMLLKLPKKTMPASKHGQQRENGEKITKNKNRSKNEKEIRNPVIFQLSIEIWVALMNFSLMNFLKNGTKDVVFDQTTYGGIQSAR